MVLKRREAWLAAIQAAKTRLDAEQRPREPERGRKPAQIRNARGGQPYTRGGQPYKRAFREPDARAQSNFTVAASGIMDPIGDGFQLCQNVHVVVDGQNQTVVATAVCRGATDQGQLLRMVDAAAATGERIPETALADAGRRNEADLAALRAQGIRSRLVLGRERRKQATINCDRWPATHRMGKRLATLEGRAACAKRSWL